VLLQYPFDAVVALLGGCLVGWLACLGALNTDMQRAGGLRPS
jgi:hypothetical protein